MYIRKAAISSKEQDSDKFFEPGMIVINGDDGHWLWDTTGIDAESDVESREIHAGDAFVVVSQSEDQKWTIIFLPDFQMAEILTYHLMSVEEFLELSLK